MPLKAHSHVYNEKDGWLKNIATEEGSVSIVSEGGTFENYKSYDTTVTTGTNQEYDCLSLLSRKCNMGYLANDHSTTTINVYINHTDNNAVPVKTGEILNLEGANASKLIISTTGIAIPYRLFIK